MQLRGSDLEAASLRTALTAAEGRVATARSAAAAAAASLASLDAKHTEVRSNYHRLYRKVMVSAPELVGKPSSRSNAAGGVAPSPFQPLMAHVEAALPSLLPSPTPAPRPAEAAPAAEEVEVAAPAAEAEEAVAAAPAPLPRPPVYDTVESDWVIRSTPDEQLQAMATADVAAAAAVACLPETNAGEEEDEEEDEDAPPHGDDYAAGGDADAAPSSEVTQCCTAAARGQPCAHRGGGWGHPVPVPRAHAPPAPPPQLPPPAVPAEKPWRKRGAAATGFLTDPVPRSSAKRPAPAPAAGDDDARYLFTPPPDDADAAAAPGAARPPVALRDCSPLALPSPPSGARTVWTLEAAAPQPRAGGGRRARPANERPAPPGGRYAEVERNRDARAAMPAFECVECAGFYAAMGMQGAPQPCSHGRGGAAAAAPGPTSHEEHLKHVGRHRAQWAPALTPAGFWNIGFDDDPAPPPPEERTRVTRPQNFCPGL
jgi:hypothetical protein